MSGKQWGILAILALIWGSSFLFIKWGLAEMSFLAVVAGRLFFGLLFLVGVLLLTRTPLPPRHLWKHLVFVAIANNVIPWTLLAWGEQYVPSGIAALLNATTPLFTFLLALVWADEKLSWVKVVGLLTGFVGVGVVIWRDVVAGFAQQNNTMILLGEIAILIMAFGYAVGSVYGRRYLKGVPAVQSATGQLFIAALVIFPTTIFTNNLPATLPSWGAIGAIAALGFFGSGMAYYLYFQLLTQVGATRTTVVTYLLPLVAIVLGWSLLGETITREMLFGILLILGGVVLVNGSITLPRRPVVPKPVEV
jgi:drug/metabolite transporter (DMT)-like permease